MKRKQTLFFGVFVVLAISTTIACKAVSYAFQTQGTHTPEIPAVDATQIPTPTPSIGCPGGNCTAACQNLLAEIMAAQQSGSSEVKPGRIPNANADRQQNIATYSVQADQLSAPRNEPIPDALLHYQLDTTTQQTIWYYFIAMIPSDQRALLSTFVIFTDGPNNVLAAVKQSADDPARWVLKVDIADAANRNILVFSLMHEFGHLLTLNASQVPPDLNVFNHLDSQDALEHAVTACPQYFPTVGCSRPDSYINGFFERFWLDIFAEWNQIDSIENEDEYYRRLEVFYEQYQDQFVSAYSATSPVEDIAETWSYFIFGLMPGGDTIAEQKILFFYEWPELVELRVRILDRLCMYEGK